MGKIVNSTFVSIDGVINHQRARADRHADPQSGVVLLSYLVPATAPSA